MIATIRLSSNRLGSFPALTWGLCATAVAIAAAMGWHVLRGGSVRGLSAERTNLLAILGPIRPIEGRLAGLAYSAQHGAAVPIPSRAYAAARQLVARAAGEPSAPLRLGDLAFIDLLSGRLAAAVRHLEEASRRAPHDTLLLSDLGAAYLARGSARHEPDDFELALGVLEKAVASGPQSLEAPFNRALALEKFHLVAQARRTWQEYIRLDPGSGWAREAERHLAALAEEPESVAWPRAEKDLLEAAEASDATRVAALVARWRRKARRLVEEDLLGRWAGAWRARRPSQALHTLTAARSLAGALQAVAGESLAADTLAAIERASQVRSAAALQSLVAGHAEVARGLALARQGRNDMALLAFKVGAERLEAAGSPFQGFALLHAAQALHYLGRDLDALGELEPLRQRVDSRRHPTLAASVLWVMGLAHLKLAHFASSLAFYRQALALFERSDERESMAALHFLLGESLRLQGEVPEAWRHRWQALALTRGLDLSPWYHNTLFDAAEAALGQGEPTVALVFHAEMVEQAKRTRDPIDIVESLLRRCHAFMALGEREAATRDLHAAEVWCARVPDEALRRFLTADLAMISGEVLVGVDPRAAARKFGVAIARHAASGARIRLPELYREQALAYWTSGDAGAAQASLLAGIAESEIAGGEIAGRQLSVAYFDHVRLLYDDMVRLLLDVRHRPEEAFGYVERSRARVLRTDFAAASAAAGRSTSVGASSSSALPPVPDLLRRHLPEGVGLLAFTVLPDRLVAWCLTAESADFAQLGSAAELAARVHALREKLPAGHWDTAGASRAADLYRLLIEPFRSQLGGKRTLVVVPDRELFRVPFASLVDPATGQFIIEDRTLVYAPSVTLFLAASERAAALERTARRPTRALAIGDPAFDAALFPDLPRLKKAEAEAREVAALYPGAELLVGRRATRTAVLRGFQRASVVHLAAHSHVDADSPLLSGFVLAPEGGAPRGADTGLLEAAELYRLRTLPVRLVVLGSCNSADGQLTASEGATSLVRPFLASGVPTVVGSLWPVDDEAGEQLMVALHRHLRRGEDAAHALRAAQLSLLASSDPRLRNPALWAGFEATGAILPAAPPQGGNHGPQ
jgi:CHAT domain-containing protein/tetratricopeptide (TPR) repeat protein